MPRSKTQDRPTHDPDQIILESTPNTKESEPMPREPRPGQVVFFYVSNPTASYNPHLPPVSRPTPATIMGLQAIPPTWC
jgi:hypothetical protein